MLSLRPIYKGKVRELFDAGGDLLLMFATNRISAFDFVMKQEVPDKGKILTQMSEFWFKKTSALVKNHLVYTHNQIPTEVADRFFLTPDQKLSSMVVKKAKRIPIECIVRGYISGSAWKEYEKNQTIKKTKVESGLVVDQKLSTPIFTPTTKAEEGHDLPLTDEQAKNLVGKELFENLEKISLDLYKFAYEYALKRGVILADTKFEFGFEKDTQNLVLIDEALTPDSSRWWDVSVWEKGKKTPPLDKQFLRNWLEQNWDFNSDLPDLPKNVLDNTRKRYLSAYTKLTGEDVEL